MKTTTANPVTSEMSHSRTTFMVKLALMVAIIFVMAFVASVLLFSPLSAELVIYLLLIVVCMMTGFLDDASNTIRIP